MRNGPGQRKDAQGRGEHHGDPEEEAAEQRVSVRDRQHTIARQPALIGTSSEYLPHPQDQQANWHDEQPEVQRLTEAQRAEINPGAHTSYPLRTGGGTLPGLLSCRSSFSRGMYSLNCFSNVASSGFPSEPNECSSRVDGSARLRPLTSSLRSRTTYS